jgi:hypothetical protein
MIMVVMTTTVMITTTMMMTLIQFFIYLHAELNSQGPVIMNTKLQ